VVPHNQFDNFHFDPNSLGSDWKSGRPYKLRVCQTHISIWNIDYVVPRMTSDYTRTNLGCPLKGDIETPPFQDHAKHQGGEYLGMGESVSRDRVIHNPFIWGYAVAHLRVKADPMFKLGDGRGNMVKPRHDVMDEKEVKASGMSQYKNYPTE
jgi:hypothetical protein